MKNYIFHPLHEKSCPGEVHFTTGILIKADIETVWDNVCKAENVKKYFTTDARKDLDNEGEALWVWGEEASLLNVLEVTPYEKFVFEWNAMNVDYKTRTTFSFEDVNGKIRVKIRETGWEMNDAGVKSAFANCSGWTEFLNALKVFIEYKIKLIGN